MNPQLKPSVRLGLCLIGGVLMGFSYPPYGITALAWICFVPPLLSAQCSSMRTAYIHAWAFYLTLFGTAFYWPLFHNRPDTALASLLAWISLTMILAIPFGVGARLRPRIGPVGAVLLTGFGVLAIAWFLRSGPAPMPGTSLGHSQATSTIIAKSVYFVGTPGLSAAMVATASLIALAVLGSRRLRLRRIAFALSVPGCFWLLGLIQPFIESEEHLSFFVLQPGTSPSEWADVHDMDRPTRLMERTDSLVVALEASPDFLLWPETALPIFDPDSVNHPVTSMLQAWMDSSGSILITGGITTKNNDSDQDSEFFNSAILFQAYSDPKVVSKNILVPFAEAVPLSNTIPGLRRFAVPAGGVPGYLPGTAPAILAVDDNRLGVLICFESHFPFYTSRLAREDITMLIVLTQNGWWKGVAPYAQNFSYNRLRALETGRSIVVASVDGMSGVFLPNGTILRQTTIRSPDSFFSSVPQFKHETPFVRFGRTLNWGLLGIWLGLTLLYGIRNRK